MKIKQLGPIIMYGLAVLITEPILTGCQTADQNRKAYPGPVLPQNQIALVKIQMSDAHLDNPGFFGGDLYISGVDGKKFFNWSRASVTLLPGGHTISFMYRENALFPYQRVYYSDVPFSVGINAEAGHTYSAYPIFKQGFPIGNYTWEVEIQDATDTAVLADESKKKLAAEKAQLDKEVLAEAQAKKIVDLIKAGDLTGAKNIVDNIQDKSFKNLVKQNVADALGH